MIMDLMFGVSIGGAPAALIYPGSRVTLKVSWSAMGRSPSRLQLCLLYTRKVGLYPYTDRSFMQSCAASSPDLVRLELVGPAHPCSSERIGPPCGYPGVTSPTTRHPEKS